jgi:hypothetical protein
MTDDTRDIAIETRSEVKRLTRTVDEMDSKLDSLIKRSDRQDGMAYAGRWMIAAIGAAGGTGATLLMKLLPFTQSLPK